MNSIPFSKTLHIYKGAEFYGSIIIKDINGEPYLLSDGEEIIFSIKQEQGSTNTPEVQIILSCEDEFMGEYPFKLTREKTDLLEGNCYYYAYIRFADEDTALIVPKTPLTAHIPYGVMTYYSNKNQIFAQVPRTMLIGGNYYTDSDGVTHNDIPIGIQPKEAYARTNLILVSEVERLEGLISETNSAISSESERIETVIDNSAESIGSRITSEITNVNCRIDNIIAHNNDTEGNTELIDIRTGTNAFIYDSAGSAVRNQLSALKNQAESIYGKFFHVYNLIDIGYTMKNVAFKYGNPDNGGGMIVTGSKTIVVFPVTPGTTYYLTQLSSIYYQIALYNQNMGFISSLYSYHNNHGSWNASWSVPDSCYYVAVVIDENYKETAFFGLQTDYAKWSDGYKYDTDSIEKPPERAVNHKLTAHSNTIEASGILELNVSDIKQNYSCSFTAKIPDTFSSVKLGHGINALYSGMYVEVTAQEVKFYRYHSSDILVNTFTHGLDIQDFITVTVNILQDQSSEVIVTSSSGSYKCANKWQGSKGTIAAQAIGCTLSDCSLSYYCADYDKKIWAFGDSYFYEYSSDRWPKIVIDNGFTGAMFDGYGGRTSVQALQSLNKCLDFGCPDTILWCMGMNDPDTNNSVNTNWKNTFDTLCSLCDEYKIRLVVCTIPTTPTHDHRYKNAIIKSSGLEYIDIEDALGVEENGSWYEGLLSGDNIHPTANGSKVIAAKMMAAFPEMFG